MFINNTGSIGILFQYLTINITGSEIISIISIFLLFIVLALLFKMPVELIMLIILPIMFVFMAYYSGFLIFGGLILIALAIMFALNYFIK